MAIERFEEMKVWQDSRSLTRSIYEATQPKPFSSDYGLKDQIQRAAVSAMSNIAEGYERDGNREFVKFLGYSKSSIGEVRSLLYVALDNGYIGQKEFDALSAQCVNIAQQLSNFIKYLRKTAK
ncbi:MAG: four helix bundle protein [Bacteroidetes bacterium]|nr:four helix bundle protein [Bacteroidota bacterium]